MSKEISRKIIKRLFLKIKWFIFFFLGECQQGFESVISSPNNSMLNCEPINHCLNTTTCHANASCHYLGPDQFLCTCHQGYTGNGTHCSRKCTT